MKADLPYDRGKFPLFISQDGTHEEVHALATSYAPEIHYLNHVEDAPPTMADRCASVFSLYPKHLAQK